MLHLVDRILCITALIAPIYCVLRLDLLGILIGSFFCWATLILAGSLLARLDPEGGASVSKGIWVLFGWPVSLVYCLAIYGLKKLYMLVRRRRARGRNA